MSKTSPIVEKLAIEDAYKKGFADGRESILGRYATDQNDVGIIFCNLSRQQREAEIRLYGVLWYLCEHEIISQGKAMELARKPLTEMIDECIEWNDDRGSSYEGSGQNDVMEVECVLYC